MKTRRPRRKEPPLIYVCGPVGRIRYAPDMSPAEIMRILRAGGGLIVFNPKANKNFCAWLAAYGAGSGLN